MVLSAQLGIDPRLPVISREQHPDGGCADPRGQHERTVNADQDVAGRGQFPDVGQLLRDAGGEVGDVVEGDAVF